VQAHTAHERDQAIGHDARQIALQRVVLSILAPAADYVEPFVQLREQDWNVRGIILQVTIERDNHFAFRKIEPSHHCCGLAEIAAEMHDFHVRIMFCELVEDFLGIIRRAVIDQNEFPRASKRLERIANAPVQLGQRARFVANGNRDGNHCVPRGYGRDGWHVESGYCAHARSDS
jgi:hypothetical protein